MSNLKCPLNCGVTDSDHSFCAVMYLRSRMIYEAHIQENWMGEFVKQWEFWMYRNRNSMKGDTHKQHSFMFSSKGKDDSSLLVFKY